jgi:hypothetical protein
LVRGVPQNSYSCSLSKSTALMEPEGPLPCSLSPEFDPTLNQYKESRLLNPNLRIYILILSSHPHMSPKNHFPLCSKKIYEYPPHSFSLDLMTCHGRWDGQVM